MVLLKMTHWISGKQLGCWLSTRAEEQNGGYPPCTIPARGQAVRSGAWEREPEENLSNFKARQSCWGLCCPDVINSLWNKATNGQSKGWPPFCWQGDGIQDCQLELAEVSTISIEVTALLMASVDVSNDISFYSICIDKTTGNGTLKKKVECFQYKK